MVVHEERRVRPQVRLLTPIKSPLSGPLFALPRAGILRRVVQIKAIEKDDLLPPGDLSVLDLEPLGIPSSKYVNIFMYIYIYLHIYVNK